MPAMSDVTLDTYQQNDPELSQYRPDSPTWVDSQPQTESHFDDYSTPEFNELNFSSLPLDDCTSQRENTSAYTGPICGGPESTNGADFSFQQDQKDETAFPGSAGLRNLGNTCFMNSGLQCLLSNPGLVSHFLEEYKPDNDETLTSSLTGQFAMLLQKVWCGEYLTIHPSAFKQILGIYHPQFKDYRQHDCQEFLALLMDSLHEQLNQGSPLAKVYDSGEESSQSEPEHEEPWLKKSNQLELVQDNRVHKAGHASANQIDPSIHRSQSEQAESVFDQSHVISEDSVQSESSIQSGIVNNSLREEPIPAMVKSFQTPNNISELDTGHTGMTESEDNLRSNLNATNFIENIVPDRGARSIEASRTEQEPCVEDTEQSMEVDSGSKNSRRLPSLEDLYMKDTKILNTNVLASDLIEEEDMAVDSEKFHKLENTSATSEAQPQFDFEHLNDLLTLDPAKGSESKPFKETNLLANVKDKFAEDIFPKKFLFSELLDDEPISINNIKRLKMEDDEKNLKMQQRLKVNTDKNPTKPINVENQSLTLVAKNYEVIPECSRVLALPTRGQHLLEQGVHQNVAAQSLPPSGRYVRMADKAWEKHLAHNQSAIVDTFHGQFKSTVVCAECHHVSLTFEPFMYLSVPLPHAMERQISVVFVPSDNKRPIRYLITLNKQDSIKTLKLHLVAVIGEESCDIIIAEVLDNHIARILEDHTLLRFVDDANRTVYAFEMLPAPDIDSPSDVTMVTQISHEGPLSNIRGDKLMTPNNTVSSATHIQLLGNPLLLDLHPTLSPDDHGNSEISSVTSSDNLDEQNKLNNSMENTGNQSWSAEDFRSNIEFQHNPLSTNASSTGFEVEGSVLDSISETSTKVDAGATDHAGIDQSEKAVEEEDGAIDGPTAADQWKTCAICLEEMIDSDLMVHASCGGTLCHSCLEMTFKHYGFAGLTCPVCTTPVDPAVDFIQLNAMADYKPKTRILSVPVVHRLDTVADSNEVDYQLFGHPNILYLPSNMTAEFLYGSVDRVVQCLANYIIILTDGQGLRCSRCLYTQHCSGCRLPRDGAISLQPGDHLTVMFTDLTEQQMDSTQRFIDHKSMEKLRLNEPLNLFECFEAFTKSEVLDVHNPWYCPKCKKNQCANKTMTVWKYPSTLVVYLKRFVFHELSSTKIDNKVAFPLEDLDLSNFISGPRTECLKYDLHGCVCHFGGANSGHYTSYAKHPVSGEWLYYNDETATHNHPGEEDYSNAYVLFYQRQGTSKTFKLPEKVLMQPNQSDDASPGLWTTTATPGLHGINCGIINSQDATNTPPGGRKSDSSSTDYDFYC